MRRALFPALLALGLACAPPAQLPIPALPTYLLVVNGTPEQVGILAVAHGRGWPLAVVAPMDSALAALPTELLLEGDSVQLAVATPRHAQPGLLRGRIAIDRGRLNRIPLRPGPSHPSVQPQRSRGSEP